MKSFNYNERISTKISRVVITSLLFITSVTSEAFTYNSSPLLKWEKEGIVIELQEHLNISDMSWPLSLLEYPIDFSRDEIKSASDLVLVDRVNKEKIPFQLTDIILNNGWISSATVCFLTDLPAGKKKTFDFIRKEKNKTKKLQIINNPIKISEQNENKATKIGNKLVSVILHSPERIITERLIMTFGTETKNLGNLYLPSIPVKSTEIKRVNEGNILSEYCLTYTFDQEKSYQITIRLIAGMEYIEINEKIEGFATGDSIYASLDWNDFQPNFRFCPNRAEKIDESKTGYSNYKWEPIEGLQPEPYRRKHPYLSYDQKLKEDNMLPFELVPYHNWLSWWRLPTATFWNTDNDLSIGIFVKDFEKWIEPGYPLWGNKTSHAIKYYYDSGRFCWKLPMTNGLRSTGLAIYPHSKDREIVNKTDIPLLYTDQLRRWNGWIPLNKVKDWILDYPEPSPNHKTFFSSEDQEITYDINKLLPTLENEIKKVALGGERSAGGPSPVATRTYMEEITPLFENSAKHLSTKEYRQARAHYLFMTYIFMDESLMPMRNMLSGHPNFLADIKSVPGLAAFLFPDHPEAQLFADHFEKSIALNLKYHIRPDIDLWNARGGRSTENMATYTWAFLRPTLKPSYILHHFYDGKNRMLQPNITKYADWLLNSLSSPLDFLNGRRGVLPQGAHARTSQVSNILNTLGQELKYYDPLLAEHIFWVTSPDDPGFEKGKRSAEPWEGPSRKLRTFEKGTNPNLTSSKYTGYGFILRKNFGQKDEMFVHLQQIDEGPNYRWGRAGNGGNGIIYYYAGGKRYSHIGVEDVGDAQMGDVERCTNFGVKSNPGYREIGPYRSIGRNDLTAPLYDFDFAQFAMICGDSTIASRYKSRSILMAGKEYIVIFDDVADNTIEGRFSWFTGTEDEFPYIYQLKPGIIPVEADLIYKEDPYNKDPEKYPVKGRYYDGAGDFLTLVSHIPELKISSEEKIYRVTHKDNTEDLIFRDDNNFEFLKDRLTFKGKAGFIRKTPEKTYKAALFSGTQIGFPGFTIYNEDTRNSVGLSVEEINGGYSGYIHTENECVIRFQTEKGIYPKNILYVNGEQILVKHINENEFSVLLPKGQHKWQFTDKGVIPGKSEITYSFAGKDWCTVKWKKVIGAEAYCMEKSLDYGNSWIQITDTITENYLEIKHLPNVSKLHLRITAIGKGGYGKPSNDYPVYLTHEKPHTPEGLHAFQSRDSIFLSWGQILGADLYTLYMKKKGEQEYTPIYKGESKHYSLAQVGATICEFTVTATNGNGEGIKSYPANTDPARFINWYPQANEVFRRDTESHENGYEEYNPWIEEKKRILTYPLDKQ